MFPVLGLVSSRFRQFCPNGPRSLLLMIARPSGMRGGSGPNDSLSVQR